MLSAAPNEGMLWALEITFGCQVFRAATVDVGCKEKTRRFWRVSQKKGPKTCLGSFWGFPFTAHQKTFLQTKTQAFAQRGGGSSKGTNLLFRPLSAKAPTRQRMGCPKIGKGWSSRSPRQWALDNSPSILWTHIPPTCMIYNLYYFAIGLTSRNLVCLVQTCRNPGKMGGKDGTNLSLECPSTKGEKGPLSNLGWRKRTRGPKGSGSPFLNLGIGKNTA